MRTTLVSAWLGVCLLAGVPSSYAADTPRIVNGQVTSRAVAGTLAAEVAAAAPGEVVWIGYAVPANDAGSRACCRSGRWGSGSSCECCGLERGCSQLEEPEVPKPRGATLEASGELSVFLRVAAGAVGRVAAYAADCEVDAGGRRVVWLTGVSPKESVAWLSERAAKGSGQSEGREGALMALAFHAEPSVDRVLEQFALTAESDKLSRSAVFWMGQARGRAGFDGLNRVLASSANDRVREHITFAMSISRQPEAVDRLLAIAKGDRSPKVRSQALFWLGQKASRKVAAAITDAVQNDPDTDVKKRAVFALSQLPPDESVTRLIEVARTNKNIEVRKQAVFWLGQSKDPRALAFIEDVLMGR